MDSVPSRRPARLVLLPDWRTAADSEPSTPSEAPGEDDDEPHARNSSERFKELWAAAPFPPQRPTSGEASAAAMNQVAHADRFPASPADFGEELGQGLGQGLEWLGGMAIALLTLLVPLTSVILDREDQPTGSLLPNVSSSGPRHGSQNSSSLPSAGVGESPSGDTGRKSQ